MEGALKEFPTAGQLDLASSPSPRLSVVVPVHGAAAKPSRVRALAVALPVRRRSSSSTTSPRTPSRVRCWTELAASA